jgi:hypothetical protein
VLESELGRRAEALRGRESQVEALTGEIESLRRRLAAGESERCELRAELDDANARAAEELRTLAIFARQVEELRIGARGAATRIRLCALREAAEVNARIIDAADPRAGAVRDRMLDALERAIDRVGRQWEEQDELSGLPAAPLGRAGSRVALASGQPAGAPRRRVSVDIGPFEDFSQLVRFEDAANAIGATGDISIKRFSGGRARIDVALSEPVDLLRELEESCDLEFRVRSRNDDEIVLDVEG